MSEVKVSKLTNRAGTGAPNFSQGVKISGTTSTLLAPTRTEGATEPTSPSNGDTWYDTANDTYDVYINNEWKRFIGAAASSAVWYGDRGIFAGNVSGNQIDYVDITTTGNATDFGNLYNNNYSMGAVSDGSRGVWGGGDSQAGITNMMQYITTSTAGNTTDFGDLTVARRFLAACGDGTYGVFGGGKDVNGNPVNVMDYITVQTTGNAADFGDLTLARENNTALGNSTYGVFAAGYNAGYSNIIDYVTIATTGNASDFGDLSYGNNTSAALSDDTRGLISDGGSSDVTKISYITVSTPSNATDFGDLIPLNGSNEIQGLMAAANSTRGLWAGGFANGTYNVIQYVTIQTLGNATDFGDLTVARYSQSGGLSGAAA